MPTSIATPLFDNAKNNWVESYYKFDIKKLEAELKNKKESYWQAAGQKKALTIFHSAAQRVPAYKDFLKRHKINHLKIKSVANFARVPFTDKKNYIQAYPLAARSWDGKPELGKLAASSSGTTGEANYWLRGGSQEFEAAIIHELLYKNFFEIDKYKTLCVIGFPMGVYVSGMATVLPSWLIAQKYPLTVASVGNNKTEALKIIKNLSPNYEQIIFIGHPFFVKDVIESAKNQGINWKKIALRLMFCSEGFGEPWREYLMEEAGIKHKFGRTLSTYGSSEMLLMAYETPISILLKELAEENAAVRQQLFIRQHTPSIFQYNPLLRYIESIDGELIFTSQSGLPLIRFNLHDSGVVIPFSRARDALNEEKANWIKSVSAFPLWQLPIVALWGRSDHTIIFYAANIYPEHIHSALHQRQFLKQLTGKFTMHKGSFKNMDEFLEINLELRPGIKINPSLANQIRESIFHKLKEINSEFADAYRRFGHKTIPRITLWSYNHAKYFKPGLKPKYINKD